MFNKDREIYLQKKTQRNQRKCLGHWPKYLRNSRFKKNLNKENEMIKDCYDENGVCIMCGGRKSEALEKE